MQDFMSKLITYSVGMSVIILIYLAMTLLLYRRYSPRVFYGAGLIIQLGLIIPFCPIDVAVVNENGPAEMMFSSSIHNIRHTMILNKTLNNMRTWSESYPITSINSTLLNNGLFFQTSVNVQWQLFAAAVWLIGVIIFLGYHVFKHYNFIKMTDRWSERVPNKQTLKLFESIKRDLNIHSRINLYICPCIATPMMIGFINPRILLPLADFSENDLSFILKHELIHYKRRDLWYKCLILVATTMHWFNPIVYLMAKAVNFQCELSCDAEVIKNTNIDMREKYCEMIIGMVKNQSKLKTALSTNFYGGKKGMKKRIVSIMDIKKKRKGLLIICLTIMMTMVIGIVNRIIYPDKVQGVSANNTEPDVIIRLRDYESLPEDYSTEVSNVDSRPELEFYIEGKDIAQIELKCENEYLYAVDWTKTQDGKYWNVDYYQVYDEESQSCTFYPERLYDKTIKVTFDEGFSDYGDIWYRWTAWNLYQWASKDNFSHFLGYGIDPKIKLLDKDDMTEEEKLKLAVGGADSGVAGIGHIQLDGYPEELTRDRITITVTDRNGNSVTKYINIKISNNEFNETVVTANVED